MAEQKVIGRINSTILPSVHMKGVPFTLKEEAEQLVRQHQVTLQVASQVQPYKAEIKRLREALSVLSTIAQANIELSKEKLEGE